MRCAYVGLMWGSCALSFVVTGMVVCSGADFSKTNDGRRLTMAVEIDGYRVSMYC